MEDQEFVVFAGEGSSHSWTWLANLFESNGMFDARFVDAPGLSELLEGSPRAVIVSGGDGLQIAETFRGSVFKKLEEYIRGGGTYIGMCAGAYLPLPSSLPPLNEFNLSTTKVDNIGPEIGRGTPSPRLAVRYGSCSVVHPIRGEVGLRGDGITLKAPLYGGPVFREPDDDEVVLRYDEFTDNTEFQMERARAKALVLGKPAVIRSHHGQGTLLLLGPHLEHPRYPVANSAFLGLLGSPAGRARGRPKPPADRIDGRIREAAADLRVAAIGLENRSFLVGNKLWDAGRFLDLVDAIQKRTAKLDEATLHAVTWKLERVKSRLLNIFPEPMEETDSAPALLVEAARECVDRHFSALRDEG